MLLRYQNQQCDLKDIDAVIFDLDGTLVESEPVWAEAKQYIANRENVDVSEQILLAYVGRSVADFVVEVIAPANAQLIEKPLLSERWLATIITYSRSLVHLIWLEHFLEMTLQLRFVHLPQKKQFKNASNY